MYWVKKDLFGCFRMKEIRDKDNETGLKEGGEIEMSIYSASIHYNDNYNYYYSDTIYISNDNYNLVYSDKSKFQLFEFLVYTVWACLKGMTPYNTLKEESSRIRHYDNSYSAPFACRSFALLTTITFSDT